MKVQIVTHLLPHELDEFERQLCILSQSTIESHEVTLDVTLNLNTIDPSQTKIPVDFFVEKFNLLQKYVTNTSWCKNHIFDVDDRNECKGINDKRRNSVRKYSSSVDAFLYLDSDLIFPRYTLEYLLHCSQQIKNKYYILSPQVTKLWDQTWDHLVNSQFINNPYGSERTINPHLEVNTKSFCSDVNLLKCNPIKFGGGWFNLISSNLLKHTDIPDELGSYGVDDTYVMFCAQIMKNSGEDVEQYLMENVIVAENYLLRNNPYKNYVSYGFTRDNCKSQAENNLRSCLFNFQSKNGYILKK